MNKTAFLLIFLTLSSRCFSQSAVDSLLRLGDTFYKKQEFEKAAPLWAKAAELAYFKISRQTYFYYAASAYASANDSINSFKCLEMAVYKFGFNDKIGLTSDDAFKFMLQTKRWNKIINSIEPNYTSDPLEAKIIDTDVNNFWDAYDRVQKNPTQAKKIYKEFYLDKGTIALEFYYIHKIKSIDNFVDIQEKRHKYYKSIRANTLKATQLKKRYVQSFTALKSIYSEAIFPPIYFVVGRLNSAGTASGDGLIIGIDQACMGSSVDKTELNTWEKNNISSLEDLPHTVAHELIHFQQKAMASDTSLLKAAIEEGMADFIGELISGKSANERLLLFAKGKEKKIWEDFKKEMYLNRAHNWIANSDQETEDKPADLGYWVGYQICRAYYARAEDKKQAINDMLHIVDYKSFLEASGVDDKFK
jgi:hypothetical protein